MSKCITEYGILVKSELSRRGKTQEWLVQEAKIKTKMYVDRSLLYKIFHGKSNEPITNAINEILNISST